MYSNNIKQHLTRAGPKTTSIRSNSQQWKDNLRKECVERAKSARRERLRKQRANNKADGNIHGDNSGLNGGRGMKRDRQEHASELHHYDNNDENRSNSMVNDVTYSYEKDDPMQTARELVEQELQKSMLGLRHCHQFCPLDGENASKRTTRAGAEEITDMNDIDGDDEEWKMSHEEYLELIDAVTEELEREDELLEEEICEIERIEALEHEQLLHEIDDFESWEANQIQNYHESQSTTYTSPFTSAASPRISCPICNSKTLIETPCDGIKCTNNSGTYSSCTFQLDIAHDGLSLQHLQCQLSSVYEQHSKECTQGVLKFRMENRLGMSMLMASCDQCCVNQVVL